MSTLTILPAILLAAAAASLAVPGPTAAGRGGSRSSVPPPAALVTPAVLLGAGAVAVLDGLRLMLALVLVGAAAGVANLVARARRRRAADLRADKVVEVCETLAGELRAGRPLVTCLQDCSDVWPEFEPVVAAGRLGADVPAAMRARAASLPGAGGLRQVAAAWQISERSGAGLAQALEQVAESARETQATRALIRSELASAQATARLVALLPGAALAMSSSLGASPWHFLLETSAGLACLALALVLGYLGLSWIDRIATGALGR